MSLLRSEQTLRQHCEADNIRLFCLASSPGVLSDFVLLPTLCSLFLSLVLNDQCPPVVLLGRLPAKKVTAPVLSRQDPAKSLLIFFYKLGPPISIGRTVN